MTAFAGILFFYFDLEKRSEQKVVKNSRTVLLVDTSLSMGIQDGAGGASSGDRRRIDEAIAELAKGRFIQQLRQDHDLVVYRFDQTDVPVQVASFAKELARGRGPHPHA